MCVPHTATLVQPLSNFSISPDQNITGHAQAEILVGLLFMRERADIHSVQYAVTINLRRCAFRLYFWVRYLFYTRVILL